MNTQYRKNLKAVAQACKDYTDEKIKKVYYDIGHNDISTDDHINEATYRFTAPANAKLLMLQSVAGNSVKYAPTTASDTTTAYQKTIPSYSFSIDRASASINILGGMSYKVNQLIANGNFESISGWNDNACSRVANNNVLTMTSTSVSSACGVYRSMPTDTSHTFLVIFEARSSDITSNITSNKMSPSANFGALTSNWKTYSGIYDTLNNNSLSLYTYSPSVGITWQLRNVNCFDLTADFGSGNEPSTVSDCATEYAKRGIDIYSYTPQQSAIRDTAPTSVVSKDSNDTTIDTLTIDSNIQALEGYGWGINDTCYNYIDFENKTFNKVVDKNYNLGGLAYSWGGGTYVYSEGFSKGNAKILAILPSPFTAISVSAGGNLLISFPSGSFNTTTEVKQVLNGVVALFELATPVETDISEYLDGNEIDIEPNGTLSFESTYSAYVPSNVSYNGVIKHSLVTAIQHSRNGVVLETRALTNNEAKYSWGITDGVRNVRTYCDDEGNAVNEGSLNVNNVDISTLNWAYNSNNSVFYVQGDNNIPSGMKTLALLISTNYTCYNDKRFSNLANMELTSMPDGFFSQGVTCILLKNTSYTDATTFKNAMNGVPLFYEKNATTPETLDDFDYFFDCEEGDTFTLVNSENLQCYATYSFLIKEAKSNE